MLAFLFLLNQLSISVSTPSPTYSQCGFENNTYVCTCSAFAECQSYQFICPDNYDCHVKCVADSSCYNTQVQWPINGTSTLTCTGWRGACVGVNFPVPDPYKDFVYDCDLEAECVRAKITCPFFANCHIICSGQNSCHDLQIFWSNNSNVVSKLTCNGTNTPCLGVPTFSPTSSPTTYPTTHPTFYPTTNDPTTLNPTTFYPTSTHQTTFYPTPYQATVYSTRNEPTSNEPTSNDPTHTPTEFNSAQVGDDVSNGEGESEEKDSSNGNDNNNNNNWIYYVAASILFCCIFLSIFLLLRKRKNRKEADVQKYEINLSGITETTTVPQAHATYGFAATSTSMMMNEIISIGKEGNNNGYNKKFNETDHMINDNDTDNDIINVINMTKDQLEGALSSQTNQTPGSNAQVTIGAIDNGIIIDDNVTLVDNNEIIICGESDEDNDNHDTLK